MAGMVKMVRMAGMMVKFRKLHHKLHQNNLPIDKSSCKLQN